MGENTAHHGQSGQSELEALVGAAAGPWAQLAMATSSLSSPNFVDDEVDHNPCYLTTAPLTLFNVFLAFLLPIRSMKVWIPCMHRLFFQEWAFFPQVAIKTPTICEERLSGSIILRGVKKYVKSPWIQEKQKGNEPRRWGKSSKDWALSLMNFMYA